MLPITSARPRQPWLRKALNSRVVAHFLPVSEDAVSVRTAGGQRPSQPLQACVGGGARGATDVPAIAVRRSRWLIGVNQRLIAIPSVACGSGHEVRICVACATSSDPMWPAMGRRLRVREIRLPPRRFLANKSCSEWQDCSGTSSSRCGPCASQRRPVTLPEQRLQRAPQLSPVSPRPRETFYRTLTARAASSAMIVKEMRDCNIMAIFAHRARTAVSVGEKAVLVLKARNR